METFKGVCNQIIDELRNNIFDSKTIEYLKLLGLEYTDDRGIIIPLYGSLFKECVNKPFQVNTKFKNKEELLNLLKRDEYTGTVVQLGPHFSNPSSIIFLNRGIVYCQGSNWYSPTEYWKINDIDIIRFIYGTESGEHLYTMFIKPQELVVCYTTEGNSLTIVKYTGTHKDKTLVWSKNLVGFFNNTDNEDWFTIYDDGQKTEVKGTQNNCYLSKIKETLLWNALNLLQGPVGRQYSRYIAGIFTAPDVARKLFEDPVSSATKGADNYRLVGKKIYNSNGMEIVELEEEPDRLTSLFFEVITNNTPFRKFGFDVYGLVNLETKVVNATIGIRVKEDNIHPKYIFKRIYRCEFKFSLDDPDMLTFERLNGDEIHMQSSDGITTIEVHKSYLEESEKEFAKKIATHLCVTESSSFLEKESGTDTCLL